MRELVSPLMSEDKQRRASLYCDAVPLPGCVTPPAHRVRLVLTPESDEMESSRFGSHHGTSRATLGVVLTMQNDDVHVDTGLIMTNTVLHPYSALWVFHFIAGFTTTTCTRGLLI